MAQRRGQLANQQLEVTDTRVSGGSARLTPPGPPGQPPDAKTPAVSRADIISNQGTGRGIDVLPAMPLLAGVPQSVTEAVRARGTYFDDHRHCPVRRQKA
jgi:hypothetical protein